MQSFRTLRYLYCEFHRSCRNPTSEVFISPPCTSTLASRQFSQNEPLRSNDGYSKDQQSYILDVINNCGNNDSPRQLIGEGNLKKIKTHLDKSGCFARLEDLLKVQGLGPRSVRKLCDKILELKDGGTINVIVNKRTQESSSLTVPSLSSNYTSAREVKDKLPDADMYVFENINWNNMVGAQLSVKIHMCRAQFMAMLIAILERPDPCSKTQPKAVFLKSRLTSRFFNQQVGSERVSSQTVVENLFQQRVSGEHSNVYIGPLMKALYLEHKGHYKESLCESLLLAIAFMDLVMLKKIDLIQSLKSKKLKKVTEEQSCTS